MTKLITLNSGDITYNDINYNDITYNDITYDINKGFITYMFFYLLL